MAKCSKRCVCQSYQRQSLKRRSWFSWIPDRWLCRPVTTKERSTLKTLLRSGKNTNECDDLDLSLFVLTSHDLTFLDINSPDSWPDLTADMIWSSLVFFYLTWLHLTSLNLIWPQYTSLFPAWPQLQSLDPAWPQVILFNPTLLIPLDLTWPR